jgi:hypothetical protein
MDGVDNSGKYHVWGETAFNTLFFPQYTHFRLWSYVQDTSKGAYDQSGAIVAGATDAQLQVRWWCTAVSVCSVAHCTGQVQQSVKS